MKKKILMIGPIFILFIILFLVNQNKTKIPLYEGEYSEAKNVIVNYFEHLLSKDHHQLELGANRIFFDEKLIEDIKLLRISENPVKGKVDVNLLMNKYDDLEEVLSFEITYYIKIKEKFKHLYVGNVGEVTIYITLIKYKGTDQKWVIEGFGY